MIDICDFAVGLSRQLYGLTIATERPGHRMMETWHPLGVVGVITRLQLPRRRLVVERRAGARSAATRVVWKPSEKTPLTALAGAGAVRARAARRSAARRPACSTGADRRPRGRRGAWSTIRRVPLVSATGSTRMGRAVGPRLAARFGRAILELGGNNAAHRRALGRPRPRRCAASPSRAVGTAGQRCTTLRRLIVHDSVYDRRSSPRLSKRLSPACPSATRCDRHAGRPADRRRAAFEGMQSALATQAAPSGGDGASAATRVGRPRMPDACYVSPALVEMPAQTGVGAAARPSRRSST